MKKRDTQPVQVFDNLTPDTAQQERNVLADSITYPDRLCDILPMVHREFFTSDDRAEIWDAIVTRYNNGEPIGLELAGSLPSIITEVFPTINEGHAVSGMPFRAQQLRDGAARRRAFLAAYRFLQLSVNPLTGENDLSECWQSMNSDIEGPAPKLGAQRLSEVLTTVRENLVKTKELAEKGKKLRISTGFPFLDEMFYGGWKGGQLIILAARPSVGKTSLMLQIARNNASLGHAVQIFSLEMTAEELAEKMCFSTGIVTPYGLSSGTMALSDLDAAEKQLAGLPFYINDFSRSLDDIVTRITQAVRKGKCDIAYIDYLGLISDALESNAKLYQVLGRITGTLKSVAKRLRIPIVLLCQMNREQVKDGKKRAPELFDLRDSGSIEQDADIVLMLENKVITEGRILAWLRKNRGGKKEWCFPFIPNKNFSAFTEDRPIPPVPELSTPAEVFAEAEKEREKFAEKVRMDSRDFVPAEEDDLPF